MQFSTTAASHLRIEGRKLQLHGNDVRLLSGAMHYFRTLEPQWEDRLLKLKAMGLNCIETYVPWNLHQPTASTFTYEGLANLPGFLDLVGTMGLHAIVRPGPYICAEWEFGGLPAWLLADDALHLRTSEPRYLAAVDRFYADLIPRLLPYAAEAGGPVIAMQVENEYGSYGKDKTYLSHLAQSMRSLGYEGLLFTSDGPTETMLGNGTLSGIWKTANFGSGAAEGFAELDRHETGPRMVMEFWNGWFDHWGEEHHTRSAEDAAKSLDEILALDGHVNLYMAHGGTNFGFWSGANTDEAGQYQPTITSYDYDCPLTEAGAVTEKYFAFRGVLARHGAKVGTPPQPEPRLAITPTVAEGALGVFDVLATIDVKSVDAVTPLPMEKIGQNSGFTLYETTVSGLRNGEKRPLRATVRDRAHVFLNGELLGVMERNGPGDFLISVPPGDHRLALLVENQGRVNYGRSLRDPKGLVGSVWLDYSELVDWKITPLALATLPELRFKPGAESTPAFYRFRLDIPSPRDGYLSLDGWGKGVAFLNGFNLGRYWSIGPQQRLYLPYPLLQPGSNEIVLFETETVGLAPVIVPDQLWR